jgi:hypothetical protein
VLVARIPDGHGDHGEVGEFHERGDGGEVAEARAFGAFGSELEAAFESLVVALMQVQKAQAGFAVGVQF